MKTKKFIKICPKCGSTNISFSSKIPSFFGQNILDYCMKCRYGSPAGVVFPEIEESKVVEFREKLKKRKRFK